VARQLHCAPWASTLLGGRKLDRHVRGGAHYPPTAIGIALALERLKQQKKLLGQHLRRLNKKKIELPIGLGRPLENSIN